MYSLCYYYFKLRSDYKLNKSPWASYVGGRNEYSCVDSGLFTGFNVYHVMWELTCSLKFVMDAWINLHPLFLHVVCYIFFCSFNERLVRLFQKADTACYLLLFFSPCSVHLMRRCCFRKQIETSAVTVAATRYVKGGAVHGWKLMRKLYCGLLFHV